MDYDEHLQRAADDMKAAERALIETGFSEQNWKFIREYIQAAILRFQLLYGRALTEIAEHNGNAAEHTPSDAA